MSSFDRYSPAVMDHFLNPRNTGDLPDATSVVTVENPACGDLVKLSLKVEKGVIVAARARTFGCAAAIATTSVLTEMLTGRRVEEAAGLKNGDVVARLGGLPEDKVGCSVLAERAVQAAFPR